MRLVSKALMMAHVNEGSYRTVLPATHTIVYKLNEPSCLYSVPKTAQSITTLWLLLISRSTEGRRLSWPPPILIIQSLDRLALHAEGLMFC